MCYCVLFQGPTCPLFLYLKFALLSHLNSAHTHTLILFNCHTGHHHHHRGHHHDHSYHHHHENSPPERPIRMILILVILVSHVFHWNFERIALLIPSFLENNWIKYITAKDRKHTLLLATNVPSWKKSDDTKCASRAAARGTALRAVIVLSSHQILPEPLLMLPVYWTILFFPKFTLCCVRLKLLDSKLNPSRK